MMMFTGFGRAPLARGGLNVPLCTAAGLPLRSLSPPQQGLTMALTMHSASVPIFARMLGNLAAWLDKAEAHAQAKKFEPAVYLTMRLAPDMLPLLTQIQIACDTAKFCVARLAGVDSPPFADDEKSLDDLRQRVRKTIDYVQSVPAAQIDGSDGRGISVPRRTGAITMTGEAYLKHYALPNFFFHVTTTYALLRHSGVELGKMDFLGALPQAGATGG
jgi:hypothetical protein